MSDCIAQEPLEDADAGGDPTEDPTEEDPTEKDPTEEEEEPTEEEPPLETHRVETAGAEAKSLVDIRNNIAVMGSAHDAILENIASVAKVVMALHADVTWLRTDIGVVHEVLDKLAENVGEQPKTTAEVLGVRQHGSPKTTVWGIWDEAMHTIEHEGATRTHVVEDERQFQHDDPLSHIAPAPESMHCISETQLHHSSEPVHISDPTLSKRAATECYEAQETPPAIWSPAEKS